MTITKPLYQPDATVAQRHIRRVAARRRRWLPVTALGLSLTGLHADGLADLAALGRTPTLNAAAYCAPASTISARQRQKGQAAVRV
jgi:predicted NAD/FAD-binding protein